MELKLWLDVNRNFFWKKVFDQCVEMKAPETAALSQKEITKQAEVVEAIKSIYTINNYREFAQGNAPLTPENSGTTTEKSAENKEPIKQKYEPERT